MTIDQALREKIVEWRKHGHSYCASELEAFLTLATAAPAPPEPPAVTNAAMTANPNCPLCQGLGSWVEGEICACMTRPVQASEVQNILMEVCQILGVKLGPGFARYNALIDKARELVHAPRSVQPEKEPKP